MLLSDVSPVDAVNTFRNVAEKPEVRSDVSRRSLAKTFIPRSAMTFDMISKFKELRTLTRKLQMFVIYSVPDAGNEKL